MADDADMAQAEQERLAEVMARQTAVKGCRLCIGCQSVREIKRKQGVV